MLLSFLLVKPLRGQNGFVFSLLWNTGILRKRAIRIHEESHTSENPEWISHSCLLDDLLNEYGTDNVIDRRLSQIRSQVLDLDLVSRQCFQIFSSVWAAQGRHYVGHRYENDISALEFVVQRHASCSTNFV